MVEASSKYLQALLDITGFVQEPKNLKNHSIKGLLKDFLNFLNKKYRLSKVLII
ncbi:MAG: hypothetical protein ACI9XO_004464 [Paraglaciecola sp.]|jgi:hypothetical protein